jgi:prepilin-type N-terminal cleavage/methylation domain-containing protein
MKVKKHRGMTLLEIIISLAVFAILLVGAAGLILQMVKETKMAQEKQRARLIAREVTERIKADPKNINTIRSAYTSGIYSGYNISINSAISPSLSGVLCDDVSAIIHVKSTEIDVADNSSFEDYIKLPSILKRITSSNNLELRIDNNNRLSSVQKQGVTLPIDDNPVIIFFDKNITNKVSINLYKDSGSSNDKKIYFVTYDGEDENTIYDINRIDKGIKTYTNIKYKEETQEGTSKTTVSISKDGKELENVETVVNYN